MTYTKFKKNDLSDILSKEWIVTNGAGAYASSSICGANTRKYHGLLVAALNPPTNRHVLVSKLEEAVLLDGDNFIPFSTNQYPGTTYPQGFLHLKSFNRSPLPSSVYQADSFEIEKTVFMPYGYNATVVEYKNLGNNTVRLRLNPLFVDRDYHTLFRQDPWFDYFYRTSRKGLEIYSHQNASPLYFSFTKGGFEEERCWYRNFQYLQESERGFDYHEDAYQIGYMLCELAPGESVYLTFTLDQIVLDPSPERLKAEEIERLQNLVPEKVTNDFYKDLIRSVDQFVVHRRSTECYSIIAGYHWFTDWGRDTMISLLGASIALDHKEESTSMMSTFLKYLNEGMVPNRFPDRDGEEPEYNTVDGTLWLFVAVYEHYQKFHDGEFLKSVYAFLGDILIHHVEGTRYNIHVTSEGFLWAGDETSQLTWMDARIGDYVVTPRFGCPVEINALWYNALKIYDFITRRTGIKAHLEVAGLIEKFERNFEASFWNSKGYLNDIYLENGSCDDKIRPNQLYAVSLPFSLVNKQKQQMICDTVEKHLFTPLGIRTLSPDDPSFRPIYGGNPWNRDTAYHQGTVWPFLMGEYMLAKLAANNYSGEAKARCKEIIMNFKDHFYHNSGIHCISEIFDGLEPTDGRGCIQQAWSIANLLRVVDKAQLWE